jgi:hypothetical protein
MRLVDHQEVLVLIDDCLAKGDRSFVLQLSVIEDASPRSIASVRIHLLPSLVYNLALRHSQSPDVTRNCRVVIDEKLQNSFPFS